MSGYKRYRFRVYAFNAAGRSKNPSAESALYIAAALPGQPTDVKPIRRDDRDITFTWEKPETGGIYLSAYEIERADEQADVITEDMWVSKTNSTETPPFRPTHVYEATGLHGKMDYMFRVRALNEVGPGPWSDVKNVTTIAGPPEQVFK